MLAHSTETLGPSPKARPPDHTPDGKRESEGRTELGQETEEPGEGRHNLEEEDGQEKMVVCAGKGLFWSARASTVVGVSEGRIQRPCTFHSTLLATLILIKSRVH